MKSDSAAKHAVKVERSDVSFLSDQVLGLGVRVRGSCKWK